eukprot:g1793.t1
MGYVTSIVVVALAAAGALYANTISGFGRLPGQHTKDMSSNEMLRRYDAYYGNATEWLGALPPHDEANNAAAVERYFTLTTDFFEYGWGDAIHMAPLKPDWSFKRSIAYWEQYFVSQMGLKKGMKVADLGMGIGGPMRRVIEYTGAHVTGVTICEHQIQRAKTITAESHSKFVQDRATYVRGDYNDLPKEMKPSSFDAAYFMESLSHSEDRASPLAQAANIVKPGGIVAAWQWMLKPAFNYSNPRHLELKRGMEYGGGLRNLIKPYGEPGDDLGIHTAGSEFRHDEFARAGLEVLESYDMGSEAIERGFLGWWVALTTGIDLPSRLTSSHYGRKLTMGIVRFLEFVGIAEPGTYRTALMLEHCGLSAALAGQLGIFTPAWLTIGRVPLDKDDAEQAKRIVDLQSSIDLALKQKAASA